MDDRANLLNHTRDVPLRVFRKANIQSRQGFVVNSGSFRPSYELSYGRLNLGGKGHFKTLVMKEESVDSPSHLGF